MAAEIKALGYVQVVLVLNMKRFVRREDQPLFEGVRGTKRLLEELRTGWCKRIAQGDVFAPLTGEGDLETPGGQIPPEKVGFLTGVFRDLWFEEHYTPAYLLDKSKIVFPTHLHQNFQFKKLFLDVWKNWEVIARPTPTGMFVVTLRREYKKARSLLEIASDVVGLQMAFDIPGAKVWLRSLKADEGMRAAKEQSVRQLLEWLGADHWASHAESNGLGYAPVQWQLAMLVCRHFVMELLGSEGRYSFAIDTGERINLQVPDPSTSPPLHDSYVIYHFDELLALRELVEGAQLAPNEAEGGHHPSSHILVRPPEIRRSPAIQHELAALVEGAILRRQRGRTKPGESAARFPRHKARYIEEVLQNDVASWDDELCLLTPRAAIIIPSWEAQRDELLVSTLPAVTSRISYRLYWEALERLVEFLLEVRVLAQVVEHSSSVALQRLTLALHHHRLDVVSGELRMESSRLVILVNEAGNLSRLVALCQALSNPHAWTRAEYALTKASHLLDQVGVPILLEHSQRNVNNITDLINHLDELYLAALSERSSRQTFWVTLGISSLSLAIIVYSLPSFWADSTALDATLLSRRLIQWLPSLFYVGNVLAIPIIALAIGLLLMASWRSWRS